MIVDRLVDDKVGYTRVYIYPDAAHQKMHTRHEIVCATFDIDSEGRRIPPTAHIHLLGTGLVLNYEDVQRIADDYAVVAHIAMNLESEKRAAYAARFPVITTDV